VKNKFFNNCSLINIYKNKSRSSDLVTQMLYGEKFKVIKKYGKWWKVKLYQDNYKGYILKKKFLSKFSYDYKISSLKANIYTTPSYKNIIKEKLPFAARITFFEKNVASELPTLGGFFKKLLFIVVGMLISILIVSYLSGK